jgi:hypothetical protein
MILHLTASTDAAGYAIYDPAAIPSLAGAELEEAFETIVAQNELGNLILYSNSFDGQTLLRVYVDEDPAGDVVTRVANLVRNGFCRFPGGRICFAGVEDVQKANQECACRGDAELAPGNYAAEGFDVDWEPGRLRTVLRDRVGSGAYTLRGILYVTTGGGCLGVIISLLTLALGALAGFWMIGVIATGVCLALLAASLLLHKLPAVKRVNQAECELQMEFPPAILVLRRLPDPADISNLHGLAFGYGHTRREKRRAFEVVFPPANRSTKS